MANIKIIWVMGLALMGVALVGYGVYRYTSPTAEFHSLQLLPMAQPLIGLNLEDQKKDRFTAESFKGRWSLVFFGFTSCPEMCPLELHELTKVLHMARQQKQTQVRAVFVSLDPERDSAQKIADYLAVFDMDIVGLRGANSELATLNRFFAIDYSRSLMTAGLPLKIPAGVNIPAAISSDYQVEHSGRIFIINPQGQYMGSFAQPHSAEHMWADLQMIIKR